MINLGFYKSLKEALLKYRTHARSYSWEVDSFAAWLIEEYGVEKFIELYKSVQNFTDTSVFEKIYGLSLKNLEKQWIIFLRENFGRTMFTKYILIALAAKNPVIICDDSYEELYEVSINIRDLS